MHFNKWSGRMEPDDSDFEDGSATTTVAFVLIAIALVVSIVECCVH